MLQHRNVLANYEIDHLPHAVNKTQQTQKYQLRAAPVFLVVCHTQHSVVSHTAALSSVSYTLHILSNTIHSCTLSTMLTREAVATASLEVFHVMLDRTCWNPV